MLGLLVATEAGCKKGFVHCMEPRADLGPLATASCSGVCKLDESTELPALEPRRPYEYGLTGSGPATGATDIAMGVGIGWCWWL